MAEFFAILTAVDFSLQSEFHDVWIESDSRYAVQMINKECCPHWEARKMLLHIHPSISRQVLFLISEFLTVGGKATGLLKLLQREASVGQEAGAPVRESESFDGYSGASIRTENFLYPSFVLFCFIYFS